MASPFLMLILLIGGHFVCDYPLQGDFLSKAKNRFQPIVGVPWYQAMTAHCTIHGTMVALITGSPWLFFAEFFIHFATDDLKCKGDISFDTDQVVHLVCKLSWWLIVIPGIHIPLS